MDAVDKYRKRRDARLNGRMDDEWKTIRGTHVLIDDEGQVKGGPSNLKKLVNESGGFKPGTKKPTKKESAAKAKYSSPADFKKALGDRDAAMSEYVQAEEDWKKAKAYRATMAGKTEDSLKKDIEAAKKAGDADKLDKAQHDLERYREGKKKYGEDFGVAAAEKKMNDAKLKHEGIDKEIKDFEKARGFGKKAGATGGEGTGKFKRIGDTAVSADKMYDAVKRETGWDLYKKEGPGLGRSRKIGTFGSLAEAESASDKDRSETEAKWREKSKTAGDVAREKFFNKTADGRSQAKSTQMDLADARQAYWDAEQLDDIGGNRVDPRMLPMMDKAKSKFVAAAEKIPDGVEFEMVATRKSPGVDADTLDKYTFKKENGEYVGKVENKEWDWHNKDFKWKPEEFFKKFTEQPMYDLAIKNPVDAVKSAVEDTRKTVRGEYDPSMEDDFAREGYKKNSLGRWEKKSISAGEKIKHPELGEGTVTKVSDSGNVYADFGGKQKIFSKSAIDKGYIARVGEEYAPRKDKPPVAKSFGDSDILYTGPGKKREDYDVGKVSSLMTGNVTNDVYGAWGQNMKKAPTGTSFTVKSGNRWHDERETFTKTDTGWRFEREVDGRGADKGNADLGRIWNSLRDGRLM